MCKGLVLFNTLRCPHRDTRNEQKHTLIPVGHCLPHYCQGHSYKIHATQMIKSHSEIRSGWRQINLSNKLTFLDISTVEFWHCKRFHHLKLPDITSPVPLPTTAHPTTPPHAQKLRLHVLALAGPS